jgi:hypothetical protein
MKLHPEDTRALLEVHTVMRCSRDAAEATLSYDPGYEGPLKYCTVCPLAH